MASLDLKDERRSAKEARDVDSQADTEPQVS
jgi:hypothetical protein